MQRRRRQPTVLFVVLLMESMCCLPGVAQTIASRISTASYTLPQKLESASSSYCVQGSCTIGPRLYLAPRTDQVSLLGWTDSSGTGHVSVLNGTSISTLVSYPSAKIKGLVVHDDSSFAALLYEHADSTMTLSKHSSNGALSWSVDITGPIAFPEFGLGDSRLAYGGGRYAAYFAGKGKTGTFAAGHNGDNLRMIDSAGNVLSSKGWTWGPAHSMAQLVGYHPRWDSVTALAVSDCYPNKGILVNARTTPLVTGDGDCSGSVSVQFGQMALNGSEWMVIFSAVNSVCCVGQGIGLVSFASDFSPTVRWLTSSTGTQERDPVMALAGDLAPGGRRFLAGWRLVSGNQFFLEVIDSGGTILQGPEEVGSSGIRWGNRDDSFRSGPNGTVLWVAGDAGSDTVRLYQYSLSPASSEEPSLVPAMFSLEQNYPNPFNPSTTIRYRLPYTSVVELTVLNSLGQLVATLVQGEQLAGDHEVRFDVAGLSSGVYFCRLRADDFVAVKKLVLVK
jgi:hypothetical protein